MVHDLNKNLLKELGLEITAYSWITEFQKRGLPHIHMVWRCSELDSKDEPRKESVNYEVLDTIVKRCFSTDEEQNHQVNSLIQHRCIKERCGKNGIHSSKCKKGGFSHQDRNECVELENGRISEPGGFQDRNTVSYNPRLLSRYNCHINLDSVSSNAVVTYIYKYMNKGIDTELLSPENEEIDEGTQKFMDEIRT